VSTHAVVKKLVDAIELGDAESYVQLFAEDAIQRHPLAEQPLHGREAIRQGEQALFDAFSDVGVEVRSVVGNGLRVLVEVVLRGTNTGPLDLGGAEPMPATGRRIELPAVWAFDFSSDGLVTEERDYFDTALIMSQLGVGQ
jgi:steroid delta-isomerase-like uncharacterized protein